MKVFLKVVETLIWHDTPQLFVAKDFVDGLHLCLAIEETQGEWPHYIVVAISQTRLQLLKAGKIDLYSVFAHPEMGAWSQIVSFEDDCAVSEPIAGLEKLPDEWLPAPGELLPGHQLMSPEAFDALKVGAVAKEAGMNPTLLRQYLSGVKRPSAEQARRVQDALHRVGQRLLEVHFV